jgi:hypothetical protein
MYDQYTTSMDRQFIDVESTFLWLSRRDVKAETESEIITTQDQALQTKYLQKRLKTERDSKNRLSTIR